MADSNCVMCERPLRRRRRHVLSARFLETRRDFVDHILRDIELPHEVCLNYYLFLRCLYVIKS